VFAPRDQPIVDFVRGTLGCRCPDDAFRSIEIEAGDDPHGMPHFTRLVIGNRLLVYVMRAHAGPDWTSLVPALVRTGCAERDRRGFNRFRLVVPSTDAAATEHAVKASFANAVEVDDRAHLHVVPEDDLPDLAGRLRSCDAG
jgi:hypothetical protein